MIDDFNTNNGTTPFDCSPGADVGHYRLVNTAILFSEEVDPVGVVAECWSLVRGLVEGYIWQY